MTTKLVNTWHCRARLSLVSKKIVKQVQAKEYLSGNAMTQAETLNFIILNHKQK